MVVTTTLWDDAIRVLCANDLGGWTKPAPSLYPHQWSWDSAFATIGLARVDPDRARRELETLFAAQWADGRVPHIVYISAVAADVYFSTSGRPTRSSGRGTPTRSSRSMSTSGPGGRSACGPGRAWRRSSCRA